jgi:hypothetical protein
MKSKDSTAEEPFRRPFPLAQGPEIADGLKALSPSKGRVRTKYTQLAEIFQVSTAGGRGLQSRSFGIIRADPRYPGFPASK